jgi:hypothetical protein
MQKDIILLFDSLRDPRDMAQMIHLGIAAGVSIELTGSSIPINNPKVIGILDSWIPGFKKKPSFEHVSFHPEFGKRIGSLKKQGYTIIGTTSHPGTKSLFSFDMSSGKHAIVFGTETTGLNKDKQSLMDSMLAVKMISPTSFYTLSAIVPVFCYEAMRQKKLI